MSDMTIKEANIAKEKAEKEIMEILQKLIREVGAKDISTNLFLTEYSEFGHSWSRILVRHFQIKLEI